MLRCGFAIVLLVLACRPRDDSRFQQSCGAPTDTLILALMELPDSLAASIEMLRRHLGPDVQELVRTVPNIYGGGSDTIVHLRSPKGEFVIAKAGSSSPPPVFSAELQDPASALPGRLRLGTSTISDVRSCLGIAQQDTAIGDTVVSIYPSPAIGPDEYIHLHFVREVLRKISWELYTG